MKHDLSRLSLAVSALVALFALVVSGCSDAPDAPGNGPADASQSAVNIGYQGMLNPWKAGIQTGAFEEATGREIKWRKFSSGAEVITAMASGDIDIAVAGSSPIATAMSRGLEVELFWILEGIRDNEALVARNGTDIKTVEDLRGKSIGVPFASTTHYHLLIALEQAGIETKEVKLLNMQPDAILASWTQARIDAAFVWSPVLNRILESGEVILTSGKLAELGNPTFDGIMAQQAFAAANPKFMTTLVGAIAKYDADYRDNKWTEESPQVKAIAKLTGAKAADIIAVLAQYDFPNLEEQASTRWLGGGKDEGAAKALHQTSVFLKGQKNIPSVLEDYSPLVNANWARAAQSAGSAPATDK
jgi:taurine transport system substrate-binding protein